MLTSRPLRAALKMVASIFLLSASTSAQPTVAGHGPFRSVAFGFSVDLPPQFQYQAVSPGGAADGFRAVLPADAAVWINGLHTDSATLDGVVAFIRAYRARCRETSATPTTLGGVRATELVFACPGGNGSPRTIRLIAAVRPANGPGAVQYNLGLESATPADSASLSAFDTLRRGFRTTPLP